MTLPRLDAAVAGQPQRYPERIVQFGGGNFLRGFVDWVVDLLNEETDFASGIALVKATPGRYPALDAQDCLFTTCLRGIQGGQLYEQTRLISAITRTVYPYDDFAAFLALARQPDIRFIFSNTTEAGIVLHPSDSAEAAPPPSFPAKLTRFLYERYQHFAAAADKGCIIIPTELITDNASRLRQLILQIAAQWQLAPGFARWVNTQNLFCNTLVDRIVPGFPADDAPRLFAQLGYEDRLLVAGEYYHSWIIEAAPSLLQEFPVDQAQTPLQVKIVPDASPYRRVKVRLLNGAHTAMVPLGLLLGLESVGAAMAHETLAPYLHDLVYREIIPPLPGVPQTDLQDFAKAMFQRFRNPHIHHRLQTIALNSATKVRERILPSLLGYVQQQDDLPPRLVLALAGFIWLYRGELIPLQDDPATVAWFQRAWSSVDKPHAMAATVCAEQALWGQNLCAVPGLVEQLATALQGIADGELLRLVNECHA